MSSDTQFKKIKGFELYAIGNRGTVINTKRKKEVRSHICPSGYSRVKLYLNGKSYMKKVHRLVAGAYLGNYSDKLEVNHKDFNKQNNNPSNLEMLTHRENMIHAWKGGRIKLPKRNK